MKSELREKAIRLRSEKKMSYGQISKLIPVSKSTLSFWLREYPLSDEVILELRRAGWQKGEASRERFRNTMRRRREEKAASIYKEETSKLACISEDSFYIAGLMLYLGEGNKKSQYTISVSNTDPKLIKFFICWMEKFFFVERKDVKAGLHLYENMDIEKEKKFWKNTLGIKKGQFYKEQVRSLRGNSFSYPESYRHGTCQIVYQGGEKKMRLTAAIKAFMDLYITF